MVVSSLEGYTLFKGITGVYFYSFESIITLSLSLFYLTKLIFMKIVRFKTVGGKSLVMISLLLMAPMHIYSSDTFTIHIIRKTKNQDFKNEKSKKTANDLLIAFIV